MITNLYPPLHAGTFDFRGETLAEELVSRGHEVRVVTSTYGLNTEQRDREVERVLQLNGRYDAPLITSYSALKSYESGNTETLRESIEKFQPDLVLVWSLLGISKSFIFTLRHLRIPVVYAVSDEWMSQELPYDPWLRWWNRTDGPVTSRCWRTLLELLRQRDKLAGRAPTQMMKGYDRIPELFNDSAPPVADGGIGGFQFDRIYFSSQYLKHAAEARGLRVGHAEVIYPGIKTDRFYHDIKPPGHVPTKFLVVSTLRTGSGAMTAMEAIKLARQNGVEATLTVYGRGESEQMAQLRSYVIQNSLPVEFHSPPRSEKEFAQIYKNFDAYIYCAEYPQEFPVTILEAMASGLPVIGARSGAAVELLRSSENSWTFKPGEPIELASRIQEIQMQPNLRAQLAETAQTEVMTRFSESSMLDQVESYFQVTLETWAQYI